MLTSIQSVISNYLAMFGKTLDRKDNSATQVAVLVQLQMLVL